MPAQLLPIATTAADSADFTVADAPVTLHLKRTGGASVGYGADVAIQLKSSSGEYTTVGKLNTLNPATVVSGPGTYRVSRVANASAVGVERS